MRKQVYLRDSEGSVSPKQRLRLVALSFFYLPGPITSHVFNMVVLGSLAILCALRGVFGQTPAPPLTSTLGTTLYTTYYTTSPTSNGGAPPAVTMSGVPPTCTTVKEPVPNSCHNLPFITKWDLASQQQCKAYGCTFHLGSEDATLCQGTPSRAGCAAAPIVPASPFLCRPTERCTCKPDFQLVNGACVPVLCPDGHVPGDTWSSPGGVGTIEWTCLPGGTAHTRFSCGPGKTARVVEGSWTVCLPRFTALDIPGTVHPPPWVTGVRTIRPLPRPTLDLDRPVWGDPPVPGWVDPLPLEPGFKGRARRGRALRGVENLEITDSPFDTDVPTITVEPNPVVSDPVQPGLEIPTVTLEENVVTDPAQPEAPASTLSIIDEDGVTDPAQP